MRSLESSEIRIFGLVFGSLLLVATLVAPAPAGLSDEAWMAAGTGLLMAVWWMTEAIPIAATSLMPLVLFPILGLSNIQNAAAHYANPLIYLFLGGFLIAQAVQESGLHRRLALFILARRGESPRGIVLGFMLATALLSMWVSNTATVLMMLPIGLSVIQLAGEECEIGERALNRFGTLLMLSIAYSASVGGVGTLIGTPPNTLMAGYLQEAFDITVGFAEWMLIGVPLVLVGIPTVYFFLTRFLYPPEFAVLPGGRELFRRLYENLGRASSRERRVAAVFVGVALCWVIRPLIQDWIPGLSDAGISISGAVILFLIPSDRLRGTRLLDWSHAARVPWGVLILFGGGLSLAAQIGETGLATWIGESLAGLASLPNILLILVFTGTVIFLTELTSNTATAAAFLPVVGSVAVTLTGHPLGFVVPATIAASCAFMLPVATPPNAVVYGSRYVRIIDMARAGIYLNLIFIVLITLVSYLLPLTDIGR